MIIAGIGSRKTPADILNQMEELGRLCQSLGVWVRSGHAPGADTAWEKGASDRCIVYLPNANFGSAKFYTTHITCLADANSQRSHSSWQAFEIHEAALKRAKDSVAIYHKGSHHLKEFGRRCHTRNYFQIMGSKEQEVPVKGVICWTPISKNGKATGGTRQAIDLARAHGIPIFNLFNTPVDIAREFLKSLLVP
jgi:hypothetical protein